MKTISPSELAEKLIQESEIELIDVRTPGEFRTVHAKGARNVAIDELDPAQFDHSHNSASRHPVYVICKSGARGQKACKKFFDAGLEDVFNVEGGTEAWEKAGLPVVRGTSGVISLDRQVRIVAGSVVFVGGCLALTVNPWFAAIPALVGAALVFTAAIDSCVLGMLLSKMPWNQSCNM